MKNFFKLVLNFLLSRIPVEIETPQFTNGGQDFYMYRQSGYLYLVTLQFRPFEYVGHNHTVQFRTAEDSFNAVVKWL